jgi:N-acetyl-anhydromuramyl-L-alanine amidase AmpD
VLAVDHPFVESPNRTRTDGRSVDVVVIHTMEIAERADSAEAVARWFARPETEVSAHYCVDADSVVQCVRERDIAWHARGGNERSIGIELAGRAGQGRAGWADAYSYAVLERAAALTAEICARYAIPVRWLRAAALRRKARGVTGHVEVSRAYRKSDHWDPGPAFPVDHFLGLVRLAQRPDRLEDRAEHLTTDRRQA